MSKLDKDLLIIAIRDNIDEINYFRSALDDELTKLKNDVEEFKKKRDYIHDFISVSSVELHKLAILVSKVDAHINEVRYTIEDIIDKAPRKHSEYILQQIKDLLKNINDED